MKRDLRIIFMGTPDFAVASLEALYLDYQVAAVVTAPDKPAGRGKKLQMSAVKQFALEKGLKVLTPLNLKDPVFIQELKDLQPDLQVVVAFRMLPEAVWTLPPLGTFNLHASLLPQYRGAAPINHAIMNGEKETGVTTFFLDHEIDSGNIIFQEKCSIQENETAGELHDKLMSIGASLVLKTITAIFEGHIETVGQRGLSSSTPLKNAPKIFKEDCKVNWNMKAEMIHNKIRGLSPYPAAWTIISDEKNQELIMKIYASSVTKSPTSGLEPGSILSDGKTFLSVQAADFTINLTELQLQGKKRMPVIDLLRGFSITGNTKFI